MTVIALPRRAESITSLPLSLRPPLLTVVVPTYNERDNLIELIQRIAAALAGVAWEIVVVDDDSPDGTARLAKRISLCDPRIRCIRRVGRRGLAGACIEGMLSSSAPYVAVIDGDLQHDESLLAPMLDRLREGRTDLVVGSRFVTGGDAASGLGRLRQQISNLGRRLAHATLRTDVQDLMSGFFMVRREVVEEVAPQLCTEGFKILADLLASARGRIAVAELGYSFRPRRAGDSKFDVQIGLEFLGLLGNKFTSGLLPINFVPFLAVGLVGVGVHLAVLTGVIELGVGFVWAQVAATLAAMVGNFIINNETTYRHARLRGYDWVIGLLLFCAICSTSALANVGAAAWVFAHHQPWLVAGLAGIVTGTAWNFALSSKLVWRRR
jgi:dolichol-phosphate mannosyltransferase